MGKERLQFLDAKDSATAAIVDGYPFIPEGSQLSFTNGSGGMLTAINEQGIKLSADKPPRLRQVVSDSQGQLLKSNIMIIYGDKELRIRNGEEEIFKSGDYYALRLIELSHEQQEALRQKYGDKAQVATALLVRGKMEAEEKYHDLTYLIYESDLTIGKTEFQAHLETLLNQQFSRQESSWVIKREELEVLDAVLKENGLRVEQEETISEQYEGLYKKLPGMYQPKLIGVNGYGDKLFYPQTDGTLILGESVVNTKGREDFLAYEQQLLEARYQAQQNIERIAFLPSRRFTKGGGQLSGVTLKETEDIVEKTAVDKDGNVVTAFVMAEPGKIFNELQVGEIEKLLVGMIQTKMGESKERILISGPLVFTGLPGVMGWGDWKGIEVNGARRIDEIWKGVTAKVSEATLGFDPQVPTRLDLEGDKGQDEFIDKEEVSLKMNEIQPVLFETPKNVEDVETIPTRLDLVGMKPVTVIVFEVPQTEMIQESEPEPKEKFKPLDVTKQHLNVTAVNDRCCFSGLEKPEIATIVFESATQQIKSTREIQVARGGKGKVETETKVKAEVEEKEPIKTAGNDKKVVFSVDNHQTAALKISRVSIKLRDNAKEAEIIPTGTIPIYKIKWPKMKPAEIPEYLWQWSAAGQDEIIDWPWFLVTIFYALLNTKVLLKEKIS